MRARGASRNLSRNEGIVPAGQRNKSSNSAAGNPAKEENKTAQARGHFCMQISRPISLLIDTVPPPFLAKLAVRAMVARRTWLHRVAITLLQTLTQITAGASPRLHAKRVMEPPVACCLARSCQPQFDWPRSLGVLRRHFI
jgi:hypothetical protein